jgi:hypothetical protein
MSKMRPFYLRHTTRASYSGKHEAKGYEIRRIILLPEFIRKYYSEIRRVFENTVELH